MTDAAGAGTSLFDTVCGFQSLCRAASGAARGKGSRTCVARFLLDLEGEVLALEEELRSGAYRPRPYRTFVVHDPKTRTICAADFRDRVVHHAVCAVLEPLLERSYIEDTYACRRDKGPLKAVARAQRYCRRYGYYLKLDVHKFFDSVDHRVLKGMLARKVRDPRLTRLVDLCVEHPVPWTDPGKGLPIGNLTSQHFANTYLSGLDHHVKETLRVPGYVRYMDDMVLWADRKGFLWECLHEVSRYLGERLLLQLKPDAVLLAPVRQGLGFLGKRIYPGVIRLDRRGWRRFIRRVQAGERLYEEGDLDERGLARSMASLVGHVSQADTRNLRAAFFYGQGRKEARTG